MKHHKEIALKLQDILNIEIGDKLGSGTMGTVFSTKCDRALKITNDLGEIEDYNKIQGVRTNNFPYIYKASHVKYKGRLYGICLREKIDIKTDGIGDILDEIIENNTNDWLRIKEDDDLFRAVRYDGLNEDDFDNISFDAKMFLIALNELIAEVEKYGIETDDFTFNNISYEDGTITWFDFGYLEDFKSPDPEYILESTETKDKMEIILNKLKGRLDITSYEKIGSGFYGTAYRADKKYVIKISRDKNEANNAHKLLNKDLPFFPRIYNVFIVKYNGEKYACIKSEYLSKPLNKDEYQRANDFLKQLIKKEGFLVEDDMIPYLYDYLDVLPHKKLKKNSILKDLISIKNLSEKFNIIINDIKYDNLRMKNGKVAYVDFGTFHIELDDIDTVILENKHNLIDSLKDKFNFNTYSIIDKGGYGIIYRLDNGKILKITSDLSEVENNKKLIGRKTKSFPYIYDAFELDNKGVILREDVVPLHKKQQRGFYRIMKFIDQIYIFRISQGEENKEYIENAIEEIKYFYPGLEQMTVQFIQILKDIYKYNLSVHDFTPYNLGKINGNLVMFDLAG